MEVSGPLPTGTVTFLLTDVEGSTAAWERDPDGTAKVIAAHYDLLDQAIVSNAGRRPVEQGEGDSVVAVFARATDAVAAALDAQRSLDGLGLGVRIAVHTGEIEMRDEGNYFGQTVIRCARLRGIGHGGQILVSDRSDDRARGAANPSDHEADRGRQPSASSRSSIPLRISALR
jgi:class 3 adenylate cyclase